MEKGFSSQFDTDRGRDARAMLPDLTSAVRVILSKHRNIMSHTSKGPADWIGDRCFAKGMEDVRAPTGQNDCPR